MRMTVASFASLALHTPFSHTPTSNQQVSEMLPPSFAAAALALVSVASASPVTSAASAPVAQLNNAANITSQLQPIIAPPTPPELKWLYTAVVKCPPDLLRGDVGPYGRRKAIPIVGGYLEGPGINGTFRDLGAASTSSMSTLASHVDSRLSAAGLGCRRFTHSPGYFTTADRPLTVQVDPRSGVFTADTRYNAVLSDGTDLYFNTYGPKAPDGSLHLHIKIETGSAAYYHLNHVVGTSSLSSSPPPCAHTASLAQPSASSTTSATTTSTSQRSASTPST